jgi:DNA-binding LacI/PurR family transcriptional regulator
MPEFEDMESLRSWLNAHPRKLTAIANEAGVSRRTVQRIVNDAGYMVKLETFNSIKRVAVRMRSEDAIAA